MHQVWCFRPKFDGSCTFLGTYCVKFAIIDLQNSDRYSSSSTYMRSLYRVFTVMLVLLATSFTAQAQKKKTTTSNKKATTTATKPAAPVKEKPKKGAKVKTSVVDDKPESPNKFDGTGFAVKLVPSFFFQTAGVELEYRLTDNFTVGLNGYYRFGSEDNGTNLFQNSNDPSLKNSFMAEVVGKYYFDAALSGFYAQAGVGVGDLVYGNGSARPFSFTQHLTENKTIGNTAEVLKPNPLRAQLGLGYQWIILPKRLVANFSGGIMYFTNSKGTQFSPFLAPSVGFIF